jgi:hypothetical protein
VVLAVFDVLAAAANAQAGGDRNMKAHAFRGVVWFATAIAASASSLPERADQIQSVPRPELPRGTAAITGVVRAAGRPVAGATVVVMAHDHYSPNELYVPYDKKQTVTDASGRFAFPNLPSLPLTVSASMPGFVAGTYGQARPGLEGTPIQLASNQTFEALIELARGARISGTVFDGRGIPTAGLHVFAFRLTPIGDGQTLMGSGGHAVTDQGGRYVIHDLPAGRYLMMGYRMWANGERSPLQRNDAGDWVIESGAVYPDGTRAAAAEPIDLKLGEARAGVDLRLRLEPATTVGGIVRFADGTPADGARVQLFLRNDQPFVVSETLTGADGSFETGRVTPGDYDVVAYSQPGPPHWGRLAFRSDGRRPQRTVISLSPGGTVTGRIVYSGRNSPPDSSPLTLFFARILNGSREDVPGLERATASPDFTYKGVPPGRFRIYVNRESLPAGWQVQSELVDGLDALDFPFDVIGSETRHVLITLSNEGTEIAGMAADANGAPSTGHTVVVFAADESYWGTDSRRIETVRPDTNGGYRFRGLPAGDYVVALGSPEIDGRPPTALLRQLRSSGRRVTLRPGDKHTINLAVR